jgi:small-conductance mechanosensitive channel
MSEPAARRTPWLTRLALACLLGLALLHLPGPDVRADTADATVPAPTEAPGTSAPDAAGQVGAGITADQSGAILRPQATTDPATATAEAMPETATAEDGEAGLSLGKAATLPTIGKTKPTSGTLDFAAWEAVAGHSESLLSDPNAMDSEALDRLRGQLSDWRQAFLGAENANKAKIDTLRQQIAALGPAPAAGVTEPDEIAKRRLELADQLTRLQAPSIAADEAYSRADGLIAEIDKIERERQADQLLKLWPTPLNPANWPAGLEALVTPFSVTWSEFSLRLQSPAVIQGLFHKAPLILFYFLAALGLLWGGRRWLARLLAVFKGPSSARGKQVWVFFTSLALAIVPVAGLTLLSLGFRQTQLLGPVGLTILGSLGRLGFIAVAAYWIGKRAFPATGDRILPLNLTPEREAQLRHLALGFGVLLMLGRLRRVVMEGMDISEAAASVAVFPLLVVAGALLWQVGRLLGTHAGSREGPGDDDRSQYLDRTIAMLARGVMAIGIVAPLLAAVGYLAAAQALLLPAGLSLALIALLYILQRLIADLWALAAGSASSDDDGLVPVLAGLLLILGSLPVFALIWGARVSDITELWARFQAGFTLGQARISPLDFLVFGAIFGAGYAATRLVKGLLRTSVMPRTQLDPGGQTAVLSGLGYVGIFLSALAAINATGIDLSGLAVVAGALSVGIGFGLQQVVSNFISGLILLVERPVAEGDWIEVGPVQGIVKSISVRSTRIQTFDRSDVIVPNSDLITQRVTNWTKYSLTGRLVVAVAAPFTADSRQVERILREIAEAQPLVLLSPPPVVALVGFGLEVMNFEIRVILRDVNFQVDVRSEINHSIARRFAEAGIPFSNAHRDYRAAQADAPAVVAAAQGEQRAQDALLAALMGEGVAARVRAARLGAAGGEEPDQVSMPAAGPGVRGEG